VTSWVARVQNGVLSNQPQDEAEPSLKDLTELLMPSLPTLGPTPRVERANSNPELEVRSAFLELDLAHSSYCSPILEEDEGPRARAATFSTPADREPRVVERGGGAFSLSPQFMFLQLFQGAAGQGGEKPLLLPQTSSVDGSLRVLDRMFCCETHKVGVLYVGPGQENDEKAIFSNQFGSIRYSKFLSGLGSLVDTTTTDPGRVFMGGLDPSKDGQFAYIWQDDAMQMVFHTATLMPNVKGDLQKSLNKKKMHIGNDYVAIVYNESGHPYTIGTVKCQFIYVVVLVEPLDFGSNKISVLCKPEMGSITGHLLATSKNEEWRGPRVVSDQNVARLTRQIALHCGLAAVIVDRANRTKVDPYASNWLERLRAIKRLKGKVVREQEEEDASSGQLHDFTGYV